MPKGCYPRGVDGLTTRQMLFIEHYMTGISGSAAAIKAGYKASNSENSASTLLANPNVQAEIKKRREVIKKKTGHTVEVAMEEALKGMELATKTGNANAYVKGAELRAKLNGLLIEKHDINVNIVSIDSALLAASNRVLPLLLEQKPTETREVIEAEIVESSDAAEDPVKDL